MQCTLISRCLDLAEKMLAERGLSMPSHLIVNADNTARETKNGIVAKYASFLVSQGRLQMVDVLFFRVGHTHNLQDQRFSILRSILSKAPTLETLEALGGEYTFN